jgi:hypothetical protein
MHEHYVMFKLKDECRKDLDEVVKRLKGLQGSVPLVRKAEVFMNQLPGPHSYDVMFHAVFDDTAGFKAYMVHPDHVPVQHYIEARVVIDMIADLDFLT